MTSAQPTTDELAADGAEAAKILQGMEKMAVVSRWKVEVNPGEAVVARFTSVKGDEVALSVEELRGYSKGFGDAFRFFTERDA